MISEAPTPLPENSPSPSNNSVDQDKPLWLTSLTDLLKKLGRSRGKLTFLLLTLLVSCFFYADKESDSYSAMVVRVEGAFHPATTLIQVEAPEGDRLYTKWGRVRQESLKVDNLKMRVTQKSLVAGCITFVEFVSSKDGNKDLEEKETYVSTHFFREKFPDKSSSHDDAEDLVLHYKRALHDNAFFPDDRLDSKPISSPKCPPQSSKSTPVRSGKSIWRSISEFLFPNVRAEEVAPTFKGLIENLTSDDAILRRDVRQLLAKKGIDAVKPVMAALRTNPDSNRLQIGGVTILSKILKDKIKTEEVRNRLSQKDVQLLAKLVIRADKTLLRSVTKTMIGLADTRAIEIFLEIIRSHKSSKARLNALKVLISMFDEFDDQKKDQILIELKKVKKDLQALQELQKDIQRLLDWDPESVTTGWAYVGISFDQNWYEKYFAWDDDSMRLPQNGDVLTATGSVNLRVAHIRFEENKGWVNSPVIGVIHPKDKVKVLELHTVADGFHWVKVEMKK